MISKNFFKLEYDFYMEENIKEHDLEHDFCPEGNIKIIWFRARFFARRGILINTI